jgi:predicted CXXCH cytochrome family protein
LLRPAVPFALGAALALGACGEQRAPAPPAPSAAAPEEPARYVGREACAGCHAAEAAAFSGSHHDRAMEPAERDAVLGDFDDRSFEQGGLRTRFFRRDGRPFVHTEGPGGALADFPVLYTFGVAPLQQYLVPLAGGRLQALTLAWDTRPGAPGRWFPLQSDPTIRPGDPLHWTGRLYNWNERCAACHSTNLRKGYDPTTRTYETTWSEVDVSCEACHGPGSRHVARAKGGGGAAPDSGLAAPLGRGGARWVLAEGAPIAHREPPRPQQDEVEACGRCHARRAPLTEDAAPGRPLEDTHRVALLEEDLYFPDGQIRDEVYEYGSFVQSAMYRAGVSCSDCHDPHTGALRAEGNALCGSCHRAEVFDTPAHHGHPAGSEGARCVACHMPERVYMEIDGRRDHSLRVPRPDLSARLGTPEPCAACHPGRGAAWAAASLAARGGKRAGRWHYGEALHAGRVWAADAGAELLRAVGDTDVPAIARATALELLARYPSREAFSAVRNALEDPDARVRRSAVSWLDALEPAARVALAAPRLRDPIRSVRLEAALVLAAVPPEALGDARPAFDLALREYVGAQRLSADTPEAQLNLGLLHATRGELDAAEASYEEALRLDPGFDPAAVNLADLDRARGRDDEGERVLRAALARSADDASLHHALGLLLVRTGRASEALSQLERAALLAPEDPRQAYVLGVALHDAGQPKRGLAVLEAAAKRFPGYPDLTAALAAYRGEPAPGSPSR